MPEHILGRRRLAVPLLCGAVAVGALVLLAEPLLAQTYTPREYGDFPVIGSRAAVWIAAQLHLFFAAFVLGVPMFAVVAARGWSWTSASSRSGVTCRSSQSNARHKFRASNRKISGSVRAGHDSITIDHNHPSIPVH